MGRPGASCFRRKRDRDEKFNSEVPTRIDESHATSLPDRGCLSVSLDGQRDVEGAGRGRACGQQLQLRRWRSFGHNGRGEKRTIKSGLFLRAALSAARRRGGGHCGDSLMDNVREYSIHPQNPSALCLSQLPPPHWHWDREFRSSCRIGEDWG